MSWSKKKVTFFLSSKSSESVRKLPRPSSHTTGGSRQTRTVAHSATATTSAGVVFIPPKDKSTTDGSDLDSPLVVSSTPKKPRTVTGSSLGGRRLSPIYTNSQLECLKRKATVPLCPIDIPAEKSRRKNGEDRATGADGMNEADLVQSHTEYPHLQRLTVQDEEVRRELTILRSICIATIKNSRQTLDILNSLLGNADE